MELVVLAQISSWWGQQGPRKRYYLTSLVGVATQKFPTLGWLMLHLESTATFTPPTTVAPPWTKITAAFVMRPQFI
jgi:hypothetical protein